MTTETRDEAAPFFNESALRGALAELCKSEVGRQFVDAMRSYFMHTGTGLACQSMNVLTIDLEQKPDPAMLNAISRWLLAMSNEKRVLMEIFEIALAQQEGRERENGLIH